MVIKGTSDEANGIMQPQLMSGWSIDQAYTNLVVSATLNIVLVSLTIRSSTMLYLFATNVIFFYRVKMLVFYDVQTTNLTFLLEEKMTYTVIGHSIV